jgi:hypothetical protein
MLNVIKTDANGKTNRKVFFNFQTKNLNLFWGCAMKCINEKATLYFG